MALIFSNGNLMKSYFWVHYFHHFKILIDTDLVDISIFCEIIFGKNVIVNC